MIISARPFDMNHNYLVLAVTAETLKFATADGAFKVCRPSGGDEGKGPREPRLRWFGETLQVVDATKMKMKNRSAFPLYAHLQPSTPRLPSKP